MTAIALDAPSVYVGTYAKYNNGSIRGRWFDLTDYADKDEFIRACLEFHSDEQDPELMFQDWQCLPAGMVSEVHINPEVWDWLDLSEEDREILAVYQDNVRGAHSPTTIEEAKEAFRGKYGSKGDWAEEVLDESGTLGEVPQGLRGYIDFESYASDAEDNGMTFVHHNGEYWVFNG